MIACHGWGFGLAIYWLSKLKVLRHDMQDPNHGTKIVPVDS